MGCAFPFFVQPVRAGFASQHAFFGGPVFGWRVGEVVEFAGLGGRDGAVAKDRFEHVFHRVVSDDFFLLQKMGRVIRNELKLKEDVMRPGGESESNGGAF